MHKIVQEAPKKRPRRVQERKNAKKVPRDPPKRGVSENAAVSAKPPQKGKALPQREESESLGVNYLTTRGVGTPAH